MGKWFYPMEKTYVCPVCGRKFLACSELWAYRRRNDKCGKYTLYCSWKCLRTLPEKRSYVKRK